MTLAEIRTEVRFLTRTDTSSFTDTDLDRQVNLAYKETVYKIMEASGYRNDFVHQVYSDLISVTGLVKGDLGFNGEYPLPTNCLSLIRCELKFDEGQTPAIVYEQSQNINSEFVADDLSDIPGGNPKIRLARNSIFVRPLPTTTVTDGIYLEYVKQPTDLSSDADEPDYSPLMHEVLVLSVAKRYFRKNPTKFSLEIANNRNELMMAEEKLIDYFEDRVPKKLGFKTYQENWN